MLAPTPLPRCVWELHVGAITTFIQLFSSVKTNSLLYQRLNKKKQSQKGEDIDQGDGDKEEKSSPSQQQQQEEDDRLEIKEGITEETEVMNMEADIFCLPQVAEVRGGVCMSSEALQQASLMLNLVMVITNIPVYAICIDV